MTKDKLAAIERYYAKASLGAACCTPWDTMYNVWASTGGGTCTNTSITNASIQTAGSTPTITLQATTSGTGQAWTIIDDYGMTYEKPMLRLPWKGDAYDLEVPHAPMQIRLPDGSMLRVDAAGNFTIDDGQAKVIYQACRMREFNRFLNASDLLAKFIAYVRTPVKDGGCGVTDATEVLRLPVSLFINWLILEAAEADGDAPPPDVTPVPAHRLLTGRKHPRCLDCGRFVPLGLAREGFQFCNPDHAARRFAALAARTTHSTQPTRPTKTTRRTTRPRRAALAAAT